MKKLFSIVLCAVTLFAALTACARKSDPASNIKETVESSPGTTAETPANSADITYKKNIVVGIEGKLVTFDPQNSSIAPMNYVARMIFDCPMYYDWDKQEIVPNVATSWDTTDGQTYTLKLRDDVYFHNGEQLKASDVKFTYERAAGTSNANQLGSMIEEISAIGDFTVQLKLVQVNYDFPYMLTLNTASILSEKAVTEDEVNGVNIGSGPYYVDSYEFGDYHTVRRNENFWGEPAKCESVTFRYMPDKSPRLIALETGEIDVCQDPELIELAHVEETEGLELQTFDSQSMVYFIMDTEKAPFDDVNFRLAVAHAINSEALIAVIREGRAIDCKSTWGWNQFGYNGGTTDFEYNLDTAKEYLAKAGYPDGGAAFEITVMAGERRTLGEMVQEQLREVGIDVKLKEVDHAGLITAMTNGEQQSCFFSFGFNAFADDSRRIIVPGSGSDYAKWDNPRATELMNLGAAEGNVEKRKEYYVEVQQLLHDEAPYVALYYPKGYFAVKEGVGGIDYYPTLQHSFRNIYMIEK